MTATSVKQWARVSFQVGIRTVPAGSLQFVDFSKPDPGAERVQRFMTAAQHAMAEGRYELAAQRLVYARDASPDDPAVLRLMTLAFWQAGNLNAAGRCVRDWARVEGERPTPHRFAARIYEDMGALDLAAEAAERAAARGPEDAAAWERIGRLRLRLWQREAARAALERARLLRAESSRGCSTSRSSITSKATSAARCRSRPRRRGWRPTRRPHGRATRTRWPGQSAWASASRRASGRLSLGDDPEVAELLERARAAVPRTLPEESAAA